MSNSPNTLDIDPLLEPNVPCTKKVKLGKQIKNSAKRLCSTRKLKIFLSRSLSNTFDMKNKISHYNFCLYSPYILFTSIMRYILNEMNFKGKVT